MKISLLTSGFPKGFTPEFIRCVKEFYSNNGKLVFIASDFFGHERTDRHADIFIKFFKNNDILFDAVQIVDSRMPKDQSVKYINEAKIIWLMGGNTLTQIKHISEYCLFPALRNRNGLTIGMSAGSINMAKRVVLAKDLSDNVPKLAIYEGIGPVDINIEPHLNSESKEHMNDIFEASNYATIYGLYDNSFIKIINDSIEFFGRYTLFKNSVIID